MRALQPAAPGIDLGTVSGSAITHQRLDRAAFRTDHADGMVLGVGNVKVAPRPDGDSLGVRKRCHLCRSAVPGIARLSGPCQMEQLLTAQIDFEDGVSFAE